MIWLVHLQGALAVVAILVGIWLLVSLLFAWGGPGKPLR